jgi:hypothetical protein
MQPTTIFDTELEPIEPRCEGDFLERERKKSD